MRKTTKKEKKSNMYNFIILLFIISYIFGTIISIYILFGIVANKADKTYVIDVVNTNINYTLQTDKFREAVAEAINEGELREKCHNKGGFVVDIGEMACLINKVINIK